MYRIAFSLGLAAFFLLSPLGASRVRADIITVGGGTSVAAFDTATGTYWIPQLASFAPDFAATSQRIAVLNSDSYFGIHNWHLATPGEMQALSSNPANQLAAAFQHNVTYPYWVYPPGQLCPPDCSNGVAYETRVWFGAYDSPTIISGPLVDPVDYPAHGTYAIYSNTYSFSYGQGYGYPAPDDGSGRLASSYWSGAWVAGTADATAVPEPASLFLLGTGLAGLAAARRRRRG